MNILMGSYKGTMKFEFDISECVTCRDILKKVVSNMEPSFERDMCEIIISDNGYIKGGSHIKNPYGDEIDHVFIDIFYRLDNQFHTQGEHIPVQTAHKELDEPFNTKGVSWMFFIVRPRLDVG